MGQEASITARLVVAGLTGMLLMAWLMVSAAPPAHAWGSSEPPPLPSISAGGYMSCGLTEDGRAVCWGENTQPSNDIPNTAVGMATPPADVRFKEVNAGYATVCGITTEDAVVCWGNDRFGKVSQVPPGTYTHVVPGLNYVCALRTDGSIACWGGDDPAAPGADALQRVVRDVPTTGEYTQLTMGIRHACALRTDNTIVCWGHNADGQTNVPAGAYTYVNAGNFTTCAIRTDGTAVCWGRNQGGQHAVPAGTFTQLSVGFAHVCGLRPDDTITCWGRNAEGQATPPAGTFTHVSAGTFHTCAMPTSGAPAVCWGNNQAGRVQPSLNPDDPWPAPVLGEAYSYQFTMDTHVAPAPTFSVVGGELPPGLTLSPGGELSGTPTEGGSYTFTVAASSLGMSPPDCPQGATGSLPCTPGNPDSVATATRVYTVEVAVAAEDPGAIAGQVTDTDTDEPIAGAQIVVTHSSGAQAGTATTDASGNYTVEDLPPGTYTVTADHPDYASATQEGVEVTEGDTTTVDFALQAHPPLTIVSVWNNLFEGQTDGLFVEWSERITPQFATPQGFTRYTIHEAAGCAGESIATGEAGFWTPGRPATRDVVFDGWENVTEGETYYLRVLADTERAAATGITNEETCVEFVALLRPDPATIAGQVTDAATGAPIAGATVTMVASDGTETVTTTNDDGRYLYQGVAPGEYTVTADAEGYQPTSQGATATQGQLTRLDFALQADPPPPPANPQTRGDCMNGGWQQYGFRNQGQCIQFVNTGKDSRV
ncbi:MAG TPA: carboxypeptidase regulatory-like domain-containing protein [Egibacteraceae bacterium]|nr:carboxypeptidase regulatory-like domain-containing protein [Egibacteraceae bacterium]